MLLVYGYGEANNRGWYIDNDNAYAFIQNPFSHHLIRIIADMALLLVMQMQGKVDENFSYFSRTFCITRIWLFFSLIHFILSVLVVVPLLLKVTYVYNCFKIWYTFMTGIIILMIFCTIFVYMCNLVLIISID